MEQKGYSLRLPGRVYGGPGSVLRLNEITASFGARHAIVFTDPGVSRAGVAQYALDALDKAGVEAFVVADVPAEPSIDFAEMALAACDGKKADIMVAVGGGSVMDVAKLMSVTLGSGHTCRGLLADPSIAAKRLPAIMIPTTAGTGAEATPNAIFLVPERRLKVGIVNPQMIADIVVLDPAMTRTLPKHIKAATGIDALAHAMECYTSNKATPLSNLYAAAAIPMIFTYLPRSYDDPEDEEANEQMLLAAFYAGVAIAAAGTTAVHALSYPLGGKYHIAHGVSNAMLLEPVMRFNMDACLKQLAEIFGMLSLPPCNSEMEMAEAVVNCLAGLIRHLEIPTDLRRYGVGESDLEELVGAALDVKRLLGNNRKVLTAEDVRCLYNRLL